MGLMNVINKLACHYDDDGDDDDDNDYDDIFN